MFLLLFSLCIGVFSDVLDLIFRDKSSRQITSDGVEFVGNVSLDSPEMQQRRLILSKCLQFLRLLAKYDYNIYDIIMINLIETTPLFKNVCLTAWMIYWNLMLLFQKWLICCRKYDRCSCYDA